MRFLILATAALFAFPQADGGPINERPNPYQTIENHFKLPDGRTWGSTSAVDIDKDGRSIWVGERCGVNSCADPATGAMSPLDPVLKFDASGKLVKSFGAGMVVFAHGIHVDRDGNVWVTDANDNRPRPARGAPPGTAAPPPPAKLVGHQVIKFSPEGKVLMTLGKAGVAGNPPEALTEPNDVVTTRERRYLRRRGTQRTERQRAGRYGGPDLEVHERREVRQELGQARLRPRRIQDTPRAWRSIHEDGCSSPTAATCGCSSSIRRASSSRRPRRSAA